MIKIPSKLNDRLNEEHRIIILDSLIPFSHLLQENKLYFFPEYTDHGINHIEGVLKSVEYLISDDTFDKLSSLDICAIIIATVLHDIGMHTSPELFRNMITGKYDSIPDNLFKKNTWEELWDEFLKDSRFWNQEKKEKVFGNKDHAIKEPNLDDLTENDIKYIGEFIRIHHARLAYEIALKGYIGNGEPITFDFRKNHELNNEKFIHLAGLIAGSHGMSVRGTFDYLKRKHGKNLWNKPLDIKVVFLMTLIRLADYIQIDSSRTDELMLKLRKFSSPFSLKEHETHLAIDCVHLENDDSELIYVEASPKDAKMYVKIDSLVQDIQKEFDLSWAILGEVYGDSYKLRYRRIVSNLTDENIKDDYSFVPKQFGFKFNNELSKLLIAPLYGSNPSYGVRELVQNAVDACRARIAIDEEYEEKDITHVTVSIDSESRLFTIVDTGIGMTIEEIEKFFLTIGSSYNSSIDWQKTRDLMKIYRTGRFGIGILAGFLIGPEIVVKTRSIKGNQGYQFTVSLEKEFIQINKTDNLNHGTTIEIVCNSEQFVYLEKDAKIRLRSQAQTQSYYFRDTPWFDWYIDSKPLVGYFFNEKKIQQRSYNFDKYNELLPTVDNFSSIYWASTRLCPKRISIDRRLSFILMDTPELFCNGFLITLKSNRDFFSIKGVEKYIPIRIPSLRITDNNNTLPINLQRTNIDETARFSFEKELAEAMCKDSICQLLAINLDYFPHTHLLFFNKSGFLINRNYIYPLKEYNPQNFLFNSLRNEKCFQGKTLIHLYFENHITPHLWRRVIDSFNDIFFSFKSNYNKSTLRFILRTIIRYAMSIIGDRLKYMDLAQKEMSPKNCKIGIQINALDQILKLCKYKDQKNKIKIEKIKNALQSADVYGGYALADADSTSNKELIKEIVSHINSLPENEKPLVFLIHEIENTDIKSDLDIFFDEYAGGDMIIPYEEEDRHKKFAKIYDECSKDIERYRELYEKETHQ